MNIRTYYKAYHIVAYQKGNFFRDGKPVFLYFYKEDGDDMFYELFTRTPIGKKVEYDCCQYGMVEAIYVCGIGHICIDSRGSYETFPGLIRSVKLLPESLAKELKQYERNKQKIVEEITHHFAQAKIDAQNAAIRQQVLDIERARSVAEAEEYINEFIKDE